MNLLGYKTMDLNQKLTLEKLNKAIRALAKKKHINLSISQSHSESKTVTHLQRNKNKVSVFANQYIDIEALIEQGFIKLNALRLREKK